MTRLAIGMIILTMFFIILSNPREAGKIPALFILGFQETMKGASE